MTSQAQATRVPQADRTRAMRARLLEATVELLVERGTSECLRRKGRGARIDADQAVAAAPSLGLSEPQRRDDS